MPLDEEDICLYVDLTKIYEDVSGHVVFGVETSGDGPGYAACAAETSESVLSRTGYPFQYTGINKDGSVMLADDYAIDTLWMGFVPFPGSSMDIEDFGDAVVQTILNLGR